MSREIINSTEGAPSNLVTASQFAAARAAREARIREWYGSNVPTPRCVVGCYTGGDGKLRLDRGVLVKFKPRGA